MSKVIKITDHAYDVLQKLVEEEQDKTPAAKVTMQSFASWIIELHAKEHQA